MTETVIDAEPTAVTDIPHRPFRVVTHKRALAQLFATYGGEQDLGGTMDTATAPQTLWWASQDWMAHAVTVGATLPQLLAPTPGFVAALDPRWLQRPVVHLRKQDIPALYAKWPQYVHDFPTVVISTGTEHSDLLAPVLADAQDLAAGVFPASIDRLPGSVYLQLEEPSSSVVEARYWIAHREVTAACVYRIGSVGWESPLFLEMLFNDQARALLGQADEFAYDFAQEVDGPPGYVVDLGVGLDGTATVLRAWPSWAADPLSADPTGVFRSLLAAHDFELDFSDYDVWRWTPDMHIYDRSHLNPPTTEEDTPDA